MGSYKKYLVKARKGRKRVEDKEQMQQTENSNKHEIVIQVYQ